MRPYLNLANLLTTGSLVAGFAALVLAADSRLGAALIAVAIAVALDAVDGHVARRTGVSGPFGCQLDSLADFVAFGVAPAMMLHESGLDAMPLGLLATVGFVIAAAWRLARFAVVHDSHRFVGLPTPPAGIIAAGAATIGLAADAALALCLALSVLMISSIAVPTLVGLGRLSRRRRPALRLVGSDGAPNGASPSERARRDRDDDQRDSEHHDDERVGVPALARK